MAGDVRPVLRELTWCLRLAVDLSVVDFWLVLPVDVLALVEVIPGRAKAIPAAAIMLAAVADAATVLTRVRP